MQAVGRIKLRPYLDYPGVDAAPRSDYILTLALTGRRMIIPHVLRLLLILLHATR
jgi:hypothetical protein